MLKFSSDWDINLKESTIWTWKTKYVDKLSRKRKTGDTSAVQGLHNCKRGRPLLLGDELDDEVKAYVNK